MSIEDAEFDFFSRCFKLRYASSSRPAPRGAGAVVGWSVTNESPAAHQAHAPHLREDHPPDDDDDDPADADPDESALKARRATRMAAETSRLSKNTIFLNIERQKTTKIGNSHTILPYPGLVKEIK